MSLSSHTLILKNNSTLWGCGNNQNGQLGLGDKVNKKTFTQTTINVDNIKLIYCGYVNTFILKNDSTLWGCGYNNCGQLGLGDANDRNTFVQIIANTNNIKSIYCGGYHTLILKNDGTLWACGDNQYGQLGLGDTSNRNTFTQVTANVDNIKSVYCGYSYTLILKNDGTLWGCGYNSYGQLGLGDTSNRNTFTQIADKIKSVYYGDRHTIILKSDGTLWACGYNGYGQLGLGDTANRNIFTQITTNADDIKLICCGLYHTLILKNNSTLWGCGNNNYGQLGLGNVARRTTFTQITTNADNIKLVYGGYLHTFILKNDGTLWGCGSNGNGQLGLGDTDNRNIFTQITTNTDDVKCFANDYNAPNIVKIYDLKIGYTETLDANNFRNIPIDKFEKLKVLYVKSLSTILNCVVSFDKKQTWKSFDGTNWLIISDTTPENMIVNCMEIEMLNYLDKKKLISGGFTGDLDFKIAMKTNNVNKTPSITKIYIEYK